ncbi:MAG: helix-turn-helix transcriptional regulator [Clostridia bacterium]|nr:helix-turn-helix transcriptional regulator [Clostridia bacterium]
MRIKEARLTAGITQEELAARMKVDRSTVTKWENGQSNPKVPVLLKLADILGCTVDELLRPQAEEKQTPA